MIMLGPAGQKFMLNFQEELAMIKDQKIRDFVLRVADAVVPAYFWERAASTSNKYHPAFAAGPGGLVRHVKYTIWWVDRLTRTLDTDGSRDAVSPNLDVCIAALLLHDCCKDGDPALDHLKRSYSIIGGCHGIDMAQAIHNRVLNKTIEFPEQVLIIMAIATHMGVWTKPAGMTPDDMPHPLVRKICKMVQIADYCAAQRVEDPMSKLSAFTVR